MTVTDLIRLLEDMPEDAEVRLAAQEGWPLAFKFGGVVHPDDLAGMSECDEHEHYDCEECSPNIVWITTGSHPDDSPYAPRAVFR